MSEIKKENKLLENPVMVGIQELALFHLGTVGVFIFGLLLGILMLFTKWEGTTLSFATDFAGNCGFIVTILITMFYMKKTKPESLAVFSKGTFSDRVRLGLVGALIGFAANFVISMLAVQSGAVNVSFNGFSFFLIAIIPASFVQCTMEEVLCRGFVPEYLKKRSHLVIITVGGICFILHHVANMKIYGINAIFCLNVFLVGSVLYLMTVVSGNFWIACGFHTAWNYTQQFVFGLPNSGITSPYALFVGADSKSNFFFNAEFGNEGGLAATVLFVVLNAILLVLLAKKEKNKNV